MSCHEASTAHYWCTQTTMYTIFLLGKLHCQEQVTPPLPHLQVIWVDRVLRDEAEVMVAIDITMIFTKKVDSPVNDVGFCIPISKPPRIAPLVQIVLFLNHRQRNYLMTSNLPWGDLGNNEKPSDTSHFIHDGQCCSIGKQCCSNVDEVSSAYF
ncbi:uncharacterized protein LOC133301717 isoform X2 [Gastrolobium bilobum]|uniref:uncharacterized protein LOC133301717 isoform X2 n=1 Tax=Gastrolobium bilobum TaxID=150636 RepID=UPI002AB0D5BC|nr:uncharacterized protein LOC133301717 isoform X2 [Gastrolobium bilobum]